jgi:hypothetical protein
MGFIDTSVFEGLPVFYNVTHAVGNNCPNLRDDVKLVQYLLMAYYDVQPHEKRPRGEIAVTGFCGFATMSWIRQFQADMNQIQQGLVAQDNRVDRIRNGDLKGSISRMLYTLAALNRVVIRDNLDAFANLPSVVPLEDILNVPPPAADEVRNWSPWGPSY